jgi:hypothetical protein
VAAVTVPGVPQWAVYAVVAFVLACLGAAVALVVLALTTAE